MPGFPYGEPTLYTWMLGSDPGASINTTPTPHQYAAIPDRGSVGGSFAQATSANQPQVSTVWTPSPAPLFGGGRFLAHSAPASAFTRVQHDGLTEVLFGLRFRLTALTGASRCLFATRSTGLGLLVFVADNGTVTASFRNETTTQNIMSASGAVALDTDYTLTGRKTNTGCTLWLGDTQIASDAFSIAPTVADPQFTLHVGASATAGISMTGFLPELLIFSAADASALPSREVVRARLDQGIYTP